MATADTHKKWFASFRKTPEYAALKKRPIAYFCAEYGLERGLYAGGLGILAADVVREAQDQKIPLVAIGLHYHRGYLCSEDDFKKNNCAEIPPASIGAEPVLDAQKKRVVFTVPIQDREVSVHAWKKNYGSATLYLLDTNLETNAPQDRIITDQLYVADKELRLKQSIVLGIGGLKFLETMRIHPSVYHLNEGHSVMLALALIHHQMKERGLSFDEAKQFARRRIVFTNHTLVPAGNEVFSNDLVALLLAKYAERVGVPVSELVRLGLVQESSVFSMTMMSLRMAGIINAVSELHAQKAKDIWGDHPMVGITNGIHIPTWDMIRADTLKEGGLWALHQKQKRKLLDHVATVTGTRWKENELVLGWGRRIVSYKRPLSLVADIQRFAAIARNATCPVRAVFAGLAHPSDAEGSKMVTELKKLAEGELKDIIVFLPSYDTGLAQLMVSGTDVWLNTPIVGFEACGTSGMKAALNGVLPCSTRDGWVNEIELYAKGWPLNSDTIANDLLSVLEHQIVPLYYDRDVRGVPRSWERNMRHCRELILNEFSATRMLKEYIELLYV